MAPIRFRWSHRGFVLLWAAVVVVAWNLVFDRMVIRAGRAYIGAAMAADEVVGHQLLINSWMPPAVHRAFYDATAVAGALMLVGLAVFTWADRRSASRPS